MKHSAKGPTRPKKVSAAKKPARPAKAAPKKVSPSKAKVAKKKAPAKAKVTTKKAPAKAKVSSKAAVKRTRPTSKKMAAPAPQIAEAISERDEAVQQPEAHSLAPAAFESMMRESVVAAPVDRGTPPPLPAPIASFVF